MPIKFFNSKVNLKNEILSGLILCGADNSSIDNVTITGSDLKNNGVVVFETENSNLTGINSSNNYIGISLYSSQKNILAGNTANSNRYKYGILLRDSQNNILAGNTANSNNYYGISLYYSQNNILAGNTANSNSNGISLSYSPHNIITNNTVKSSHWGIYSGSSSNNTMKNNMVESGVYGIYLKDSSSSTLHENKILSNNIGICSEDSSTIINSNLVCWNANLDFNSFDWKAAFGTNNTCGTGNWNDTGKTGCTNICPSPGLTTTKSQKSTGGRGSSSSIAFKKMCGNTLCEENETCENCPCDCGVCPAAEEPVNESELEIKKCPDSCSDDNKCTDDHCSGETNYTCKHAPIIPCCGNNLCEKVENCISCPEDCGNCRLEVICTKDAAIGEAVECRVTGNKNNPLPDTTVKLMMGNNTIIKTTGGDGRITFIPENSGIIDITFEKSGYDPAKINVSVTPAYEEKTVFDLITKGKFELVSILILTIILLLFLLFGKRKRRAALESV